MKIGGQNNEEMTFYLEGHTTFDHPMGGGGHKNIAKIISDIHDLCSKENALIFDTTCISLVKQFDVSSYKIITMTQSFVFLIQPVSNYWWCHGLITGKGKDIK